MKLLKEIGYRFCLDGSTLMPTRFAMCSPKCARTSYSDAERREFARELLSRGFSAGLTHADCENIDECEADFIEEFLKSEGL